MPPHGASGGWPALDLATRAGRELLAPQSEALALPSSCAFAALHAASALQEELPPSAADHFALHAVHLLPCGVMHKAARDNIEAGSAFRIHCFKLHASRSTHLNARISQWALQEEGKALDGMDIWGAISTGAAAGPRTELLLEADHTIFDLLQRRGVLCRVTRAICCLVLSESLG